MDKLCATLRTKLDIHKNAEQRDLVVEIVSLSAGYSVHCTYTLQRFNYSTNDKKKTNKANLQITEVYQ